MINKTLVLDYIKDYLPHLDRGKFYTVEELLREVWKKSNDGERRQSGRIVSKLVKQNKLPFREGKNGNTKTYYLI